MEKELIDEKNYQEIITNQAAMYFSFDSASKS